MSEPLFTLEFTGAPVPAMRPRFTRAGNTYNDPTYQHYKAALASQFRRANPFLTADIPERNTKQRGKWLASHRYELSVQVYTATRRGDLDNYVKTVQDAMQDAGVIGDDVQIDGYRQPFFKTLNKDNPRIVVTLWRLEDSL